LRPPGPFLNRVRAPAIPRPPKAAIGANLQMTTSSAAGSLKHHRYHSLRSTACRSAARGGWRPCAFDPRPLHLSVTSRDHKHRTLMGSLTPFSLKKVSLLAVFQSLEPTVGGTPTVEAPAFFLDATGTAPAADRHRGPSRRFTEPKAGLAPVPFASFALGIGDLPALLLRLLKQRSLRKCPDRHTRRTHLGRAGEAHEAVLALAVVEFLVALELFHKGGHIHPVAAASSYGNIAITMISRLRWVFAERCRNQCRSLFYSGVGTSFAVAFVGLCCCLLDLLLPFTMVLVVPLRAAATISFSTAPHYSWACMASAPKIQTHRMGVCSGVAAPALAAGATPSRAGGASNGSVRGRTGRAGLDGTRTHLAATLPLFSWAVGTTLAFFVLSVFLSDFAVVSLFPTLLLQITLEGLVAQ